MALTLRRWVGAAIVGCSAISIAYLPPSVTLDWLPRRQELRETPERRILSLARSRLAPEHETLLLLQHRDRVLEWMDGLPDEGFQRPNVYMDTIISEHWETLLPLIRQEVAAQWEAIGPTSGEVRFALAVVVDSGGLDDLPRVGFRSMNGELRSLLPRITDGRTCVTLLRIPQRFVEQSYTGAVPRNFLPSSSPHYLGPCAWYAAFGHPGRSIGVWFGDYGHLLAYDAWWNRPTQRQEEITPPNPFLGYWPVSYRDTRCAAGSAAACTAFVVGPPDWNKLWWRGRELAVPGITFATGTWGTVRFAGYANSFLADLIRDKGRDRFARFWHSRLDLPTAFEAAMDEPVGEWATRWATSHWLAPPPGPAPRVPSTIFSLTLAVIVIAVSALASSRRQVR